MAVAFILGLYLGALVKALVDDIIMPIVQFATPNVAWEAIEIGPFRVGHLVTYHIHYYSICGLSTGESE